MRAHSQGMGRTGRVELVDVGVHGKGEEEEEGDERDDDDVEDLMLGHHVGKLHGKQAVIWADWWHLPW